MFRFRSSLRVAACAGGCLAFLAAAPDSARAQSKLDARYTASLAGIPLGKGAWVIDIADDQYTASASGVTTGLVRVFTSGEGSGAAHGSVVAQKLAPATYAATIATGKRVEEIRMSLSGGNVRNFDINPPSPPSQDRVPILEAHRRGVLDPMTAALVRVPGSGDLLAPDSCPRHIPVFDGRMRYDLDFVFKRMDKVKAEKGYEGPVLVCAVFFAPVAGHIPDRPAIKYLSNLREMEVWLAPVAGTRMLVPFRFSVPTPLGTGVVEATQFVFVPQPVKASVKTQ